MKASLTKNARYKQTPSICASQRRKTYAELPLVEHRHSIPNINISAAISKQPQMAYCFPNDLERSFHLGLLSCKVKFSSNAADTKGSDTCLEICTEQCYSSPRLNTTPHEETITSSLLNVYQDDSLLAFDKSRLPDVANIRDHSSSSSRNLLTYGPRKRNVRAIQETILTKELPEIEAENSDALAFMYSDDNGLLPQKHKMQELFETEQDSCTTLPVLDVCKKHKSNISSKSKRRVAFADESKVHIIPEIVDDIDTITKSLNGVPSDPLLCQLEGDEKFTRTDWVALNQYLEDSDLSDPPFPLSQKYISTG